MKTTRNALLCGLALSLVLAGGASAQSTQPLGADFTKYVAVGDSLTAGYASSGLAKFYQDYSYPLQIAKQASPNAGSFQQPLVKDPGINPVLILKTLVPLQIVPSGTTPGAPLNATLVGPYNNLGIPGANTNDLLVKTGDITRLATGQSTAATVMYDLILRDKTNSAVKQAVGAAGTFYTVWAGNNDILGAAIYGIALDGVTLTPLAAFTTQYSQLLGAIRQGRPNARIVVATIPDVAAIPFVTTVKPYITNPATGAKIYLLGEAGPLTDADYVTLGASSLIAQGYGVPGTGKLLPEGSIGATGLVPGVILRASEVSQIRTRTAQLNGAIDSVAQTVGAAVWDANAYFAGVLAHGYMVGGVRLTGSFLTGGLFSYDGVHPQRLGYAIVANEFIKTTNLEFGTTVPEINLRPLVLGTSAVTSVAASDFVFSREAWKQLAETMAPGIKAVWSGSDRPVRGRMPSAAPGRAAKADPN